MKKIKIWQMCILLVSALILVSSCLKDDDDVEMEFEITVPTTWYYNNYYYDDFLRYEAWSPERLEDDADMVKDSISEFLVIYRQPFSGTDLDQFYVSLTTELSQKSNYATLYESDTTINGEDAKKLIHLQTIKIAKTGSTTDSVDLDYKPMKLIFCNNEYGYVIDCYMLPFTYDHYKPIFEEEIIPSFNFKN